MSIGLESIKDVIATSSALFPNSCVYNCLGATESVSCVAPNGYSYMPLSSHAERAKFP